MVSVDLHVSNYCYIYVDVYMFLNPTVLFNSLISTCDFCGLLGILCIFMYSTHRGSFISYFPDCLHFPVSLHWLRLLVMLKK